MITGIKGKLTALALLCAVLPCVLISVLAFISARDALEAAVRTELTEIVTSNSDALRAQIERGAQRAGIDGSETRDGGRAFS